ncbi:uncharacterized protein BXZ73DRAFT_90961 [Epithele typhae]|uniref:uncharacterized protein n=1 Tax=Epithele typhae TaxID=378194 RepID=UPI0020086E67|nr:uncharacterized protein BXZ73DRAFT_90961 [Epithele typhae]KAH9926291.1 hypothetical protein BXZ73DRAFT_90961 [Epithele typhae]
MSHTAWTSDRLAPKSSTPPPRNKPKHSNSRAGSNRPTKERGESDGDTKDPKGGCFCLARVHPLSQHTPICRSCALVLCEVNLPQFACPHCAAALLSDAARATLLEKLNARIDDTLAKEEAERQRVVDAARAAQGAFPTLGPSSRTGTPTPPANQTHKVLSLDSKTRKVKVATYTPPSMSRTASLERVAKAAEPEYTRVPAPSPEVVIARAPPKDRPWANMRGLNVTYVPPTRVA